jgi:hypothetical protein
MYIWFTAIGLVSLGYGLFTLLNDKHNERMRKVWRRNETTLDRKIFPGRQGEFISRYLTGATFAAVGILFLVFALLEVIHF